MDIEEHYSQLLGVNSPWDIHSVDLNMTEQRVDIVIEYTDIEGPCPECGGNRVSSLIVASDDNAYELQILQNEN